VARHLDLGRPGDVRLGLGPRLGRFVLANGAVSLVGNVVVMATLTGGLGVHPLPANALAIAACSVVNFWLGDHFVFRLARPPRHQNARHGGAASSSRFGGSS
jgi:putative flippase GtrA